VRRLAPALLSAVFLNQCAVAGEIPGLAPMLPPIVDSRFELNLSNDFLGRGGSTDDFRTQQIIATADAGRWRWLVDYSILTLSEPGFEGRIDQLSASLGYRLLEREQGDTIDRVFAGGGLRRSGEFAGERIQNGFHRLVGSDTENLPYSDVEDTLLTGWVDAERYALLTGTADTWRFGYWLRGRALATSDGQVDTTAMVAGVARKGSIDAWAGLRRDWRTGYDEPVQRATARAEDDLAAVIGMRFGSLVLETVQQFENEASFGQLRLLSLEADARHAAGAERFGLETSLLMPDVHVRIGGRMRWPGPTGSGWPAALTATLDFGEPQLGGDPTLYVETRQAVLGVEWARSLSADSGWLSGFVGGGVGYRDERVIGDGDRAGAQSGRVGRGVVVLNAGLRLHASSLGSGWRYRIQTGVTAWLPWGDARVTVDGDEWTIQAPSFGVLLGVSFERH
jgi:hypothetical protein